MMYNRETYKCFYLNKGAPPWMVNIQWGSAFCVAPCSRYGKFLLIPFKLAGRFANFSRSGVRERSLNLDSLY